jgi:RNA polymerase-binding transcription factor DksA
MPQKKVVKKSSQGGVKKTAKKAAASKKPVGKPAKNKKPVQKAASKPAKKVAPKKAADKKIAIKKAKPVAKPVNKTTKKAAVKPSKAVAKPASRINEKHKEIPMAKQKRQEEPKPQKTAQKKQEPVKEVKLPKITTKTSVPYQPSYKSLEQRQEVAKPSEPLVRYSDAELNEFRELIQRKLESAKKELAYLQGLITRKDDMGGDESENRYMTMEDGSMSMEREQLSQMASRQITYIDHLEKALIRIENKTYGICRVTGKLIDKARLRAVPHATLSLEAKLGLVKAGE